MKNATATNHIRATTAAVARTAVITGATRTLLAATACQLSDLHSSVLVEFIASPFRKRRPKAHFSALGRAAIHTALARAGIEYGDLDGSRLSVHFEDGTDDHQHVTFFVEEDEAVGSRAPDADGWHIDPSHIPRNHLSKMSIQPSRAGAPPRFLASWAGTGADEQSFDSMHEALNYALGL